MTDTITQLRDPILGLMRNASISSNSNIPAKPTSSKACHIKGQAFRVWTLRRCIQVKSKAELVVTKL